MFVDMVSTDNTVIVASSQENKIDHYPYNITAVKIQ